MKPIDLDPLLDRMARLEQAAFGEFEEFMRDVIAGWLEEFGFSLRLVATETPRCLLALGVMVVRRRAEIKPGDALHWCRVQTRNLVLLYWREADARVASPTTLTARIAHKLTESLDGTRKTYARVARAVGVPPGWLRRRHKRLLAALPEGALGGCRVNPGGLLP
jgi:hypothetical protein